MLGKKFAVGLAMALVYPWLIFFLVRTVHPVAAKDLGSPGLGRFFADSSELRAYIMFSEVIAGVAAFIIGALAPWSALGGGLMFASIGCVLLGTTAYWGDLTDDTRLALVTVYGLVLFAFGMLKIDRLPRRSA